LYTVASFIFTAWSTRLSYLGNETMTVCTL